MFDDGFIGFYFSKIRLKKTSFQIQYVGVCGRDGRFPCGLYTCSGCMRNGNGVRSLVPIPISETTCLDCLMPGAVRTNASGREHLIFLNEPYVLCSVN